jgi:hypothetical protein
MRSQRNEPRRPSAGRRPGLPDFHALHFRTADDDDIAMWAFDLLFHEASAVRWMCWRNAALGSVGDPTAIPSPPSARQRKKKGISGIISRNPTAAPVQNPMKKLRMITPPRLARALSSLDGELDLAPRYPARLHAFEPVRRNRNGAAGVEASNPFTEFD